MNEDGEINVLDLTAVSHYMGQKVPKGATWLFSSDEITIGEHFWVRADLPGETGEQMDFKLENCGSFFLIGGEGDNLAGEIVHGRVGGLESLIIISDTGEKSPPSTGCSLLATTIKSTDGSEVDSFTKSLTLRSARVTLSNVDWSTFRQGIVESAIVSVDKRATSPIKEFLSLSVCRVESEYHCSLIGGTDVLEFPADGTLTAVQLKMLEGYRSSLPDGKYLLIAFYGQGGAEGETVRLAAQSVELGSGQASAGN